MSQNDFNIANQGFPSFRSDLNGALQALASNSAGTSAPATTYAYMWWYDSTNNILKMRNADNDAWIDFASFDQATDAWSFASVDINGGTIDGTVIGGASAAAVTGTTGTFTGDFAVDTNTLKVDSTNNRVGIVKTSPAFPLDVTGAIATDTGIYLGGTGAANLLDDYEEGTWTPSWTTSTSNPTVTYYTQTGYYTKAGNVVTAGFRLYVNTTSGGAGTLRISGLPFQVKNTGVNMFSGAVGWNGSGSFNTYQPVGYVAASNNTFLYVHYKTALFGTVDLPISALKGGALVEASITYLAN